MSALVFDLSNLDGSNGFRLDGVEGDHSGLSVSSAGDVNGDGFDDVIIGGDYSSYMVFGQATGFSASLNLASLDGASGFRFDNAPKPHLGHFSVSDAGDVNGDGFDDVIIGAPGVVFDYYSNPDLHDGASYVVFGQASGFTADMDLSSLDGGNGFRLDVAGSVDIGGNVSVSGTGDFNGDGFDDVIVGVSDVDPNDIRDAGSSYVVFGKAAGFSATMNLSSVDGSNGFRLNGVAQSDFSGWSVSGAGDVNGDGFDDLVISAPRADPNGVWSGSSYVVFGRASGFDATLDLSSLDGSNGFRLDGERPGDFSGRTVSNAGDVNGDGFEDLIIGAPEADSTGNIYDSAGSSYVVFGRALGFDAVLDLSGLDGNNGFRLDGAKNGDNSGWSVSGAGDVNGDSFDDLIIGAPFADPNGFASGSSYVVFGRASGFSATLDLSSLDGSNGFLLDGERSGDFLGREVSNAGDVNGDGFDDLIIGAPGADPNGDGSGSSYVVFGRSDFGGGGGGGLPEIPGTPGDDVLRGTSLAEIFEAGDGNDRMIGRGGADVFHGGAGVDQIKVPDLNFESIDGGIGNDILHLDGKDLNLDLTALGDKIHGIETICLYGRGDNMLTLTADSMLDLSDTSNILKLHGNAGDRVTVQDNGWIDGGVKGFYHTYTNDDAVLLVGANLAIDFV